MSYINISIFFSIVVLLYAAANPVADATIFQTSVRATGRVCCTITGNCAANATAISGAVVSLNCPTNNILGPATVATQNTTDAAGNFTITAAIRSIRTVTQCRVTVQLPLTGDAAVSCPLLANATTATGSLASRLQIVSISGNIFVRVVNAVVASFAATA